MSSPGQPGVRPASEVVSDAGPQLSSSPGLETPAGLEGRPDVLDGRRHLAGRLRGRGGRGQPGGECVERLQGQQVGEEVLLHTGPGPASPPPLLGKNTCLVRLRGTQ